jgi:hypothetical protein
MTSISDADVMAKDLLDRARADIALADNKTSILLAGTLAAAGGLSAALGSAGWSPSGHSVAAAVGFWLALVGLIVTVFLFGLALYPRNGPSRAGGPALIAYFGDVAALTSPAELGVRLSDASLALSDVWLDQAWWVSCIAVRKYWLLSWGMRALGVTTILAALTILLSLM